MPLPSSSRSSTSASRRNRGAKKLGGPPLLRRTAVSPVDVSSTHPIKRPSKSRKEEKEVGRESWEEIDRGTTKIVTTWNFSKIYNFSSISLKRSISYSKQRPDLETISDTGSRDT